MSTAKDFWPEGIKGAVSLTFDDGLITQLDNALPMLDEHDLQATFYVNPGRHPEWEEQIPRWQAACRRGHEIGNHTSRHPCSCNFAFDLEYCLEKLTLEDIAATIDQAEAALDELFPEQKGNRSFCYPCYQSYVGAGVKRQSYVPLVARRFKAARGGGETANNPYLIDLSYTWAWAVTGNTGPEMIDYIEQALNQGHWAIICMHGIGAQHLAIGTRPFREMVEYLSQRREQIWTAPLIDIANFIIKRREEIGIE